MRFKITYVYEPDAWFVIEMRGDQSLDDLHWAILGAVDFDADHLYAFFISGKAWDKSTEYSNNKDARGQSNIRLQKLPLRLKQRFLYLVRFRQRTPFSSPAHRHRSRSTHGHLSPDCRAAWQDAAAVWIAKFLRSEGLGWSDFRCIWSPARLDRSK